MADVLEAVLWERARSRGGSEAMRIDMVLSEVPESGPSECAAHPPSRPVDPSCSTRTHGPALVRNATSPTPDFSTIFFANRTQAARHQRAGPARSDRSAHPPGCAGHRCRRQAGRKPPARPPCASSPRGPGAGLHGASAGRFQRLRGQCGRPRRPGRSTAAPSARTVARAVTVAV